jgi:hypothetical protein
VDERVVYSDVVRKHHVTIYYNNATLAKNNKCIVAEWQVAYKSTPLSFMLSDMIQSNFK